MNLEFGNIVKIFPIHIVEKIENGEVVVSGSGTPIIAHASDFDVNPDVSDSPSSLLTNTPVTLYADKLTDDDAQFLRIKRSVIVEACKSNGDKSIIGSMEYPAKITLTRTINRDILKVEHKQPSHLG